MSIISECIKGNRSTVERGVYKPYSYIPIYESFLAPFIGREVTLVEIGVGYGGCLQMWQKHLGSQAKIYGIEKTLHPDLINMEVVDGIEIIPGDQANSEFLKTVPGLIPSINIIIDDGSHINSDQIKTFEALFMHLAHGGLYFVEDTHTSYRDENYGGGYKKPGTFLEYCKTIIDALHRTEDPRIIEEHPNVCALGTKIDSIHFYPTMVVIKKKELE